MNSNEEKFYFLPKFFYSSYNFISYKDYNFFILQFTVGVAEKENADFRSLQRWCNFFI